MGVGDHYTYICMVSGTCPVALPTLPIGAIGSMADDYRSLAKMVFNMVRMSENWPKWPEIVRMGHNWPVSPKMARKGQNGLKLSKWAKIGRN